MKKLIIILSPVILLVYVYSCGEKKVNEQKALYDKMMSVHDEIMPKMGDLMRYKRLIRERLEVLTRDSIANAEEIATLRKSLTDLDNAHDGMMDWMHKFNRNFEDMTKEEIMQYLEGELEKIETVGKMTNKAMEEARKALGEEKK